MIQLNNSQKGSSPPGRTNIIELRRQGVWPFPVFIDGKDVYKHKRIKKPHPYEECKGISDALF